MLVMSIFSLSLLHKPQYCVINGSHNNVIQVPLKQHTTFKNMLKQEGLDGPGLLT